MDVLKNGPRDRFSSEVALQTLHYELKHSSLICSFEQVSIPFSNRCYKRDRPCNKVVLPKTRASGGGRAGRSALLPRVQLCHKTASSSKIYSVKFSKHRSVYRRRRHPGRTESALQWFGFWGTCFIMHARISGGRSKRPRPRPLPGWFRGWK